jgi:hypothetical protein
MVTLTLASVQTADLSDAGLLSCEIDRLREQAHQKLPEQKTNFLWGKHFCLCTCCAVNTPRGHVLRLRCRTEGMRMFQMATFLLMNLTQILLQAFPIISTQRFSTISYGTSQQMSLKYPEPSVIPAENHSATVIMLHGLGDTAAGWLPVGMELKQQLPHVKWVFPTAPTVCWSGNSTKVLEMWCTRAWS